MTHANSLAALRAALGSVTPRGAAAALLETSDRESLGAESEQALIADAAPVRRSEFLTGRASARLALGQLGMRAGAILQESERGLPAWPKGSLGSISHTKGYCGALAGWSRNFASLGLDLERTDRLSRRAAARVLHPEEATELGDDQELASLYFSAKEAFFKAQYPRWGVDAGFQDAILAHAGDRSGGVLQLRTLGRPFTAEQRRQARSMIFRYAISARFVMVSCALMVDV